MTVSRDKPRTEVAVDSTEGALSQVSDHALLTRVARRQPDALSEIYKRHSTSVSAHAAGLCGRRRSDEVVRMVFLRLWGVPTDFVSTAVSVRTHLLATVHRLADATGPAPGRPESDGPSSTADDEAGPRARDERCDLTRLPRGQREAVMLAAAGGCTYQEIALALRLPEADVLRDIRSGLARLRSLRPCNRSTQSS